MQFDLKIPRKQVDEAYEHVLDEAAKESTVAGFRQGKAPRKLVEEKVGREKLIEATLQHVLPKAYGEAIREKNLKPLTSPKITPKKVANDGDWEFGVVIASAISNPNSKSPSLATFLGAILGEVKCFKFFSRIASP